MYSACPVAILKVDVPSGGWTFTYLFGSANQNTYEVVSTARNGACYAFLSCTDCTNNLVDVYRVVSIAFPPIFKQHVIAPAAMFYFVLPLCTLPGKRFWA